MPLTPDLQKRFEEAADVAKRLSRRPDNDSLLALYALYKQATQGDASGKRPGFTDFVGRAKYDAWTKLKGLSADEAMKRYVELVQTLQEDG